MKVLMLNGSRREKGCTFTALNEIAKVLTSEGIESEIVHIGSDAVNGKIGESVRNVIAKLNESDALIVGSPVYFAGPSGEVKAFLDRLFYTPDVPLRLKPAAAIASARRGGTTATVDVLNKYFEFAEMPIVSSRYWNIVHGNTPEELMQDEEGIQIMRVLGANMAWLLKCIQASKDAGIVPPPAPEKIFTNFIRG